MSPFLISSSSFNTSPKATMTQLIVNDIPNERTDPEIMLEVYHVLFQALSPGVEKYRHRLFIMSHINHRSGIYLYAAGSPATGFSHREEHVTDVAEDEDYHDCERIGSMLAGDLGRFREACGSVITPLEKQPRSAKEEEEDDDDDDDEELDLSTDESLLASDREWVNRCVSKLTAEKIMLPVLPRFVSAFTTSINTAAAIRPIASSTGSQPRKYRHHPYTRIADRPPTPAAEDYDYDYDNGHDNGINPLDYDAEQDSDVESVGYLVWGPCGYTPPPTPQGPPPAGFSLLFPEESIQGLE